jgi:hypothetical protein
MLAAIASLDCAEKRRELFTDQLYELIDDNPACLGALSAVRAITNEVVVLVVTDAKKATERRSVMESLIVDDTCALYENIKSLRLAGWKHLDEDILEELAKLRALPVAEAGKCFRLVVFDGEVNESEWTARCIFHARKCDVCHESVTSGVRIEGCAACRSAYYCSKACQRVAWAGHKHICKNLARVQLTIEEHESSDVNTVTVRSRGCWKEVANYLRLCGMPGIDPLIDEEEFTVTGPSYRMQEMLDNIDKIVNETLVARAIRHLEGRRTRLASA